MPEISGHTQTLGLIGTPIKHSLSPAMHTFSCDELGIDAVYLAYEVGQDKLQAAVEGFKALGFMGYNVTMPNKTAILQYLDELTDSAALMGAVNTVKVENGKSIGHNTDGAGFWRNVRENGVDVVGKKVTIVGVGGAGSAIYCQAALDGVAAIDIYKRNNETFDSVAARVAEVARQTGCNIRLIPLDDQESLKKSIAESVLFINATNVGMGDSANESIVPVDYLPEGIAVADVVYNPRVTKLLADAQAKGLKTISGLGMLLWQAAIAEDFWFGKEMPTDLVEERFFN